jgi:hypothetical protein
MARVTLGLLEVSLTGIFGQQPSFKWGHNEINWIGFFNGD